MFKTINFRKTAIVLASAIFIISCNKEIADQSFQYAKTTENQNAAVPEHVELPASYHIQASEKLTIPASIELPQNLPGGNERVATYYAIGVQKYKAQLVSTDPMMYQWVFVAPQADLYDITNKKIGSHSAGPSWQLDGNGSTIFGQHFQPARTAPSQGTIDWLLLMPKAGTTPTGLFADVDYIQRIATTGGRAPVTMPTSLAETAEVPYTAIYRFSKINQ